MREVYFEMENAILQSSYESVVERLAYYESAFGTAEATTLRDLLSHSDRSIRVSGEQYQFAYLALDLIERGKGVAYCKACKRYYQTKDLRREVVGHGDCPFSVNVKGRKWLRRFFGKEQRSPLFWRKGVSVSRET